MPEQRAQQLVQRGEGIAGLGLDRGRGEDPDPALRRPLRGFGQQRGLPASGTAADDQRGAGGEHRVELLGLALPTEEPIRVHAAKHQGRAWPCQRHQPPFVVPASFIADLHAGFNARAPPGARLPIPVPLRCLIVDDNPEFLEAATRLLKGQGVDIVGVASSSVEAVKRAQELAPRSRSSTSNSAARAASTSSACCPARLILISTYAERDFADPIAASPARGLPLEVPRSRDRIEQLLR